MDVDKSLTKREALDHLEESIAYYEKEMKEHEGSSDELYYEGVLESYGHILTVVQRIEE